MAAKARLRVSRCPLVRRCTDLAERQFESLEEARRNLVEALELYFEDESELVVNESPVIVALDVAV